MNDAFCSAARLFEATAAVAMPIQSVVSQANAIHRCASDAPNSVDRKALKAEIERLEGATATLREVLDLGKPVLRLVAAE